MRIDGSEKQREEIGGGNALSNPQSAIRNPQLGESAIRNPQSGESAIRNPQSFDSVTVLLPVINETHSLRETVDVIEGTCRDEDIREYLCVVCDRTTPDSISVIRELQERLGEKFVLHHQKLPFIGGAMREAFELARGSHTIMMSTDLETDPEVVQVFIAEAKKRPASIVTCSRWLAGGSFKGYNPVKLVANYVFQKMLGLIYGTSLSDLTYAYRIFPTALLQAIRWEELRHPFFLETIIKPLRLGVKVTEVPGKWVTRDEGVSQNTFFRNFEYFRIALRVRFSKPARCLRNP